MLCECIAVQWVANIFLCVSCRSFRFLMKLCYSGCASVRLLPFSFPFLTFTPSNHPISFRQTYSINRFDVLCTVLCCAELCSASPPLLLLLFTCHYETRFIVWFLLNADAFSGVMFLNILLFLCVFRFILSIVFFSFQIGIHVLCACTEWNVKIRLILLFTSTMVERKSEREREKGGWEEEKECPTKTGKTIIRSKNYHYYLRILRIKEDTKGKCNEIFIGVLFRFVYFLVVVRTTCCIIPNTSILKKENSQ